MSYVCRSLIITLRIIPWGGGYMLQRYYVICQTSARIPACNSAYEIAKCGELPLLWIKESAFSCRLLYMYSFVPLCPSLRDTACWKSLFLFRTHNLCLCGFSGSRRSTARVMPQHTLGILTERKRLGWNSAEVPHNVATCSLCPAPLSWVQWVKVSGKSI